MGALAAIVGESGEERCGVDILAPGLKVAWQPQGDTLEQCVAFGQALGKALQSEAECMSVLQQIASIRGAVNGLMLQVLEGHVSGHLNDPDASPQKRQEDTRQLLSVLRSYLK